MMLGRSKTDSLLANSRVTTSLDGADASRGDRNISFFRKALIRVTTVLVIATICFTIRIIMLIVKMVAFHDSVVVSSPGFPLFGFGWFVFSDFIPRVVPTVAFIAAMISSHRHTEADKKYFAAQASRVAAGKFSDLLDPDPMSAEERSSDSVSQDRLSDEDLSLSLTLDSADAADHIPTKVAL